MSVLMYHVEHDRAAYLSQLTLMIFNLSLKLLQGALQVGGVELLFWIP